MGWCAYMPVGWERICSYILSLQLEHINPMDSNRNRTPRQREKNANQPPVWGNISYPKEMEPGTHQVSLTKGKHLKTLISIVYSTGGTEKWNTSYLGLTPSSQPSRCWWVWHYSSSIVCEWNIMFLLSFMLGRSNVQIDIFLELETQTGIVK